jgi:branched-chain amino acid transport system permease protein
MFGQYLGLMLLGFRPQGDVWSEGTLMTITYLVLAGLIGMAVSGTTAVGLEFIAYRPLRKHRSCGRTY